MAKFSWSLDDERIHNLEKENRSLKRKLKRRDTKIKDLESKLKSFKTVLEASDLERLRSAVYGRWNY